MNSDGRGGFKRKGPRLIIVHAGGEAGWTDLIFNQRPVITTVK